MRAQVAAQTNCDTGLKGHVYLLRVPAAWTFTDVPARFLNADPISDHRDTNSFRNLDHMRDIKVMGKKRISIPPATHVGAVGLQVRDYSFNFKIDEKIRYADGNNVPIEYKYILFLVADRGNCHPTVANTENQIPVKDALSGAQFGYHLRWWYVDN